MIRLINTFLIVTLLCTGVAQAAPRIVVLQSVGVKPYNDALQGIKSVANGSYRKIVLTEMEGADLVRTIRQERPDAIIAIGAEALARAKKFKDVKVIFLMVLDTDQVAGDPNISGIGLSLPPEKYLSQFQKVAPQLRKIGLIFNPEKSGQLVKVAQQAARGLGIELIPREVHSAREVPAMLEKMKGGINAFWMLPDTTVVTPETVEYMLLFSLSNKIPVMTFSEKYAENGALISVNIEPYDTGRQAGELLKKVLSGKTDGKALIEPRSVELTINATVAKKLGITLSDEILAKAKIVR